MFLRILLFSIIIPFFCNCCSDPRSEREKVRDRILIQFSKKMQKKNLFALGMGGGCSVDKKINLISSTFKYNEVMNIENARELIVDCINELLKIIHSNKKSAAYFESVPPSLDILFLSIIGQEPHKQMNYIRVVSIIKGKIYYSTDDPERKIMPFIDVHEETFEEAVKIVSQQSKDGSTPSATINSSYEKTF